MVASPLIQESKSTEFATKKTGEQDIATFGHENKMGRITRWAR